MRNILIAALILSMNGLMLAQSTGAQAPTAPAAPTGPTATIETSMGNIHCTLFPDKAPVTVANFIGLATGKKQWTNPKTGKLEKGRSAV